MGDEAATVATLREAVAAFVTERDWAQFHLPKDLALGLVLEAGEVLEHFQWRGDPDADEVRADPVLLQAIGDELADVLHYLLLFANVLDIDLSEALRRKMAQNAERYPVETTRGKARLSTDPKP